MNRRLGQFRLHAEHHRHTLENNLAEVLPIPPTTPTSDRRPDPKITRIIDIHARSDKSHANIVEARPGEPTPISPNDDDATRRAIQRENESAQILAGSGFHVVQNPVVAGPMNPDYLINGEVYDHYAPSTDNVRRIWERVKEKVERGQASNIVIGLQDSVADEEALRRQFAEWPIDGLGEVLIVRPDGTIGGL